MDFECIYELLYIILTLLCFGFNITTTYFLPVFKDSWTKKNVINFCKRLNNTIFIFGIILSVYFQYFVCVCCCKLCRFIVIEYFIILFVIIQWSLTLGLMKKINENKIFKYIEIDGELSVKVIFIIFCFFLITLIIRLILGMIKEKFKKITILNIITFIFEICFTIINLISSQKKFL